jgi:hypothetical protein
LVHSGLWLLLSRFNEPVGRVLVALGSFFVHLTFVVFPLYLIWQSQRTQRLSIPVWKRSFLYPGLFGSLVGIVGVVLSVRLHQLHLFLLVSKVSQLFTVLTNLYQGENIITAIQLISWIPLLIWNSLDKGRTKNEGIKDEAHTTPMTSRSCLKTSSSCGKLDTTGRDQPQPKRDDIPSGQGSQLDALMPSEDWKMEASNDENNGYLILSYRRSDGTTTHKRVSMPMTQPSSSYPQRPLPVLCPVRLKSTIDHKDQPDKEDEEHKQIPTAGNVCCKFDQLLGVDVSNWLPNSGLCGLTTVEKVSKLELSTLLEEHARDMELANPWDKEFHNFTDDGPAPWLNSQTDTRQCILTLFHLLRRGCKCSSLGYSRLSLALEKTMQHMRDILQESFTNTEQLVPGMFCSAPTDYDCKTVLNVLIMCMTIGARFKIQDHCGQVVVGSLEHVQEHSNDTVDLYFEVSDGPSIVFGGWLGWLPFMWAAGLKGPKITLSEDGLALPPSWFSGEAPHVSSSVDSDRDG